MRTTLLLLLFATACSTGTFPRLPDCSAPECSAVEQRDPPPVDAPPPVCGGHAQCGPDLKTCCAAGEICYGIACVIPGDACLRQADCSAGQVCEADLGICLDRAVLARCEYHPPVGEFRPEIECRWEPPAHHPHAERNDVVMAPAVANLTDDNGDGLTDAFDTPDLVFTSYNLDDPNFPNQACCNVWGTLRVVSGGCSSDGTMTTHASLSDVPIDNSGGVALGDLDGDGVAEIVAMTMLASEERRVQGTVAYKRARADGTEWEVLWHNTEYPTWNVHTRGGSQPSIIDLDGDGRPEVVVGNVALRGTNGALLWDGVARDPGAGRGNNAFLGPVSSVADIDLDGAPEILAGNTAYSPDGTIEWTFEYTTDNSPCGGTLPCDGFTAAANFDQDAEGEVVIVRRGEVFILEHDGRLAHRIILPTDDCENNESGPPTIADFDGDGRPEIGTAAADFYTVVDLDCLATPLPDGCDGPGILWKVPNQDCSSRVTASSVFDFDGDGRAEAVYADEDAFRIFDGATGEVLFSDETHGSHTRLEMVVIADVDNDGNAEVVIAENASKGGTPGVEIWGDALDNWVYTRRIWNQHSYHVTNVGETGNVGSTEAPNWLDPSLNNFRQNVQGEGLFWSPDLVVLGAAVGCDPEPHLALSFRVMNQGSRRIGAGAPITLYGDGTPLETLRTTRPLMPGEVESFELALVPPTAFRIGTFDLRLVADDDGTGAGETNECAGFGETNNVTDLGPVSFEGCAAQ